MTRISQLNQDYRFGGKYLTFNLGGVEYAIQILKVVEIFGFIDPTIIPHTPPWILGLINLRGKILPIMDLREKFGLHYEKDNADKVIIEIQANNIAMGILVDNVSEVVNIHAENIEDTPYLGANINTEYILGIDKSQKHVKILLNIDKIINKDELATLTKVSEKADAELLSA
ncbi:MAG TPA: chemotaxis protein CheW [bacterium]|nr:chemotaxis protein CheW [bacterium]HPN46056.1 chemotaxis protein CheW [bacterium]